MKFTKFLSVLASLIAGMCLMASAVSFSDVEGHWAYEQIMEYAEKGIVNGDPEGTFRPDDTVTREEFCKIMLNAFGVMVTASETESFSDVPADAWSYAFVEGAKMYLPGYDDGTYLPGNEATRADVTAAIVKIMGYPVGIVTDSELALTKFSDGADIDEDLVIFVSLAVEKGLVNGDPEGTFRPGSGITRAEAVTLISRAVKTYEEKSLTWDEADTYIDVYYPENDDDAKTVLTVNGYDVSLSEFRYYYLTCNDTFNYYFGEGWVENEEVLDTFLEYIDQNTVFTGILYGAANSMNTKVSLKDLKENVYMQYDYMGVLAKQNGMTAPEYLALFHATPNYMMENCLAAVFSDEIQNILYGADSEHYGELSKVFETDYVRAKHVLIMFDGKASKEAALAVAEEVLGKAKAGESFDTLVAEYNEDPGMISNPDGYIFTYGQMVEPFEKASFALKEDEISGIIETEYGYHIIKRLALDDEMIASSDAYMELTSKLFDEYVASETSKADVVIPEDYNSIVMLIMDEAGHIPAEENVTVESIDVENASADEIINAINEVEAPEFMFGVMPVEITDADALKMFTGLDSEKGIKEASVCESMMGSQAYSLVVVKLENGADAKKTAEAMKAGIDQRKWICVEADDIKVSGKGNTVMLIMIDSEYKDFISASSVTEAFKMICGGELDFEI